MEPQNNSLSETRTVRTPSKNLDLNPSSRSSSPSNVPLNVPQVLDDIGFKIIAGQLLLIPDLKHLVNISSDRKLLSQSILNIFLDDGREKIISGKILPGVINMLGGQGEASLFLCVFILANIALERNFSLSLIFSFCSYYRRDENPGIGGKLEEAPEIQRYIDCQENMLADK
jgi:hypothetical protein